MSPEQLIIENLLAFRETQAEEFLQEALRTLEASASELDEAALTREVETKHLKREWDIVRSSYLLRFVNL
jgi:hypothetical protein